MSHKHDAEFEILATVGMKISIFWDVTSRIPAKINQHFGGT
jgi:hypothetical protein